MEKAWLSARLKSRLVAPYFVTIGSRRVFAPVAPGAKTSLPPIFSRLARRFEFLTGLPWAALFLFLAAAPETARAGQDKEFYVNTYRSIGTVNAAGRRSAGMGRAGAGLAAGVDSLSANPAGLGAFTGYEAEAGTGFDLLDDGGGSSVQNTFRLGGAVSLERWKPSGGGNQTVGGLVATERYGGAGDAGMKRRQTGVVVGYGAHLLDDVVAGASAAVFDGDWRARSDAWSMERDFIGGEFRVGAIYRLADDTTAGAVLGYSTGSYHEKAAYAAGGGPTSLSRWNLRAGGAYQLCDETLIAGDIWYDRMHTEVERAFDERSSSWGVSVGVEQLLLDDVMALRGGAYYDYVSYRGAGLGFLFDDGESFAKGRVGFTAGAGLRLRSFDVGYSLDVNTGGDVRNYLDVSAEW